MIIVCPNCGGRVKVEEVEEEVEGGHRVTVYKGRCEKCGARLVRKVKIRPKSNYLLSYSRVEVTTSWAGADLGFVKATPTYAGGWC